MSEQKKSNKTAVRLIETFMLAFVTTIIMSLCTFGASAKEYTYTVGDGAVYNVKVGDVVNLIIPNSASQMSAYAYYWFPSAGEDDLDVEKSSQSSMATFTFKRGGTVKVPCGLNGTIINYIPQTRYDSFTNSYYTYYLTNSYSQNYDYTITFNVSDNRPPQITSQPVNVIAAEGKKCTVNFEVYSYLKPLTYTWYYAEKGTKTFKKAKTTKSGKYTVTMDKTKNGRKLYCIVTDSKGQRTKTDTVTIKMADKVKIKKQPESKTVVIGNKTNISLKATGTGKLTYTWYYADKGSNKFSKSSVKTSYYSPTATKDLNGRRVYCVVKDAYGQSVKSNTVKITLSKKVGITKQPTSVTVRKGSTASVKVNAYSGNKPLKYRWYYANKGSDKFKKSSVTDATYSIKMNEKLSGRRVYCVVVDSKGNKVKSKTATLKMAAQVKITSQPKNKIVATGNEATIKCKATGTGKLTYTWYMKYPDSDKFEKNTDYKGNTFKMLINADNNGTKVYCVIKDTYGQKVKSKVVTLKMAAPIVIKNTYVKTNSLGQVVSQTVEAEGEGKLTYTWYRCYSSETQYTAVKNNNHKTLTIIDNDRYNTPIFVYCEVSDNYGQMEKTGLEIFNFKATL